MRLYFLMISCKEHCTIRYVGYYLQRRVLHICRDPGVEERPNGITVHSLPPTGRQGGFNSNTTTRDLLYQKVVAAHGLLGLSRLSNRKGVKAILPFEMNTMSLEESPAFPSTTEHWSPQRETKCPQPKVGTVCLERLHALPFYRKRDVMLMSYVRMFRAQWREGL